MSNIATAIAIAEATQEAVHDNMVMEMARDLLAGLTNKTPSEFTNDEMSLVFKYSATLASATATYVSSAILGNNNFDNMVESVQEFENMERDVFGE